MSFNRFNRRIVVELNFDVNTFLDSEPYKQFVKENPNLKNDLDRIISDFLNWAENPHGKKDLRIDSDRDMNYSSYWTGEWHRNENSCKLYKFKNQMGTTFQKFSITENSNLSNKILQLFANVFNEIGFTTFVAEFSFCKVEEYDNRMYYSPATQGYDYTFTLLDFFDGVVKDSTDKKHVHICVSI